MTLRKRTLLWIITGASTVMILLGLYNIFVGRGEVITRISQSAQATASRLSLTLPELSGRHQQTLQAAADRLVQVAPALLYNFDTDGLSAALKAELDNELIRFIAVTDNDDFIEEGHGFQRHTQGTGEADKAEKAGDTDERAEKNEAQGSPGFTAITALTEVPKKLAGIRLALIHEGEVLGHIHVGLDHKFADKNLRQIIEGEMHNDDITRISWERTGGNVIQVNQPERTPASDLSATLTLDNGSLVIVTPNQGTVDELVGREILSNIIFILVLDISLIVLLWAVLDKVVIKPMGRSFLCSSKVPMI